MKALASAAFFCSKKALEDSEGSVGMESKFFADAVRTRVLKVALHLFSNDFLFTGAAFVCAMMLLESICSSFPFMLSKTDGLVVGFCVWGSGALKMECIRVHSRVMAWDTWGDVGTVSIFL